MLKCFLTKPPKKNDDFGLVKKLILKRDALEEMRESHWLPKRHKDILCDGAIGRE